MKEKESIICPFCEEGSLNRVTCKKCGQLFLRCDECESVYKDRGSLDKDYGPGCPHCGADIDS
ncbi:MAG TPA: hypothetical protein PLM53_15720 [Spirochaetota bacterium]|nr:hypothetical protein [Spirochaetota bacterium]HPC40014.1 hypothetical protein [Spirochaetota bacterium]HPL15183.1 hypothetical protein [Spirochaetota bacterium]HQF09893.1 hypothetical protein [Spirochaetota bacterium]HQH98544.1 hypothetical protein [Spirochaetota bacterium]